MHIHYSDKDSNVVFGLFKRHRQMDFLVCKIFKFNGIYCIFIHNKFEKSLKGQACFVLVHSSAFGRNVCVIIVVNSFMTRVTWCITRGTATRVAWWSSPCPPPWPPSTVCPGTCRRTAAAPYVGPGRPQCSRRSWEELSVLPILSLDVFLTVILSSISHRLQ